MTNINDSDIGKKNKKKCDELPNRIKKNKNNKLGELLCNRFGKRQIRKRERERKGKITKKKILSCFCFFTFYINSTLFLTEFVSSSWQQRKQQLKNLDEDERWNSRNREEKIKNKK